MRTHVSVAIPYSYSKHIYRVMLEMRADTMSGFNRNSNVSAHLNKIIISNLKENELHGMSVSSADVIQNLRNAY
jgi:hypothetical protein